jgi:magnesium transporter
LATGDLAALRVSQVFTREAKIALLVAASCAVVGGLICGVLPNILCSGVLAGGSQIQIPALAFADHIRIVSAFTIGMFSAIMVATTFGLFLPFLFRRIGIDPAISSGPLVTTANDAVSVAIYLGLTLLLIN